LTEKFGWRILAGTFGQKKFGWRIWAVHFDKIFFCGKIFGEKILIAIAV
jgi:hypothetical protein